MSLRFSSLRSRLMALIVLALLPVVGLLFYNATRERQRKLQDTKHEIERMSGLAAASAGKVVEGARQMLLFLSYAEPVRSMDAPVANKLLAELASKSKECAILAIAEPDGNVFASSLPLQHPVNIGDRPWFTRLQQTRSCAIGEYQIGRITKKATLNLAFPLPGQSESKPLAVVFAGLNLETLQECITLPPLPRDTVIVITDRNGIILARSPRNEQLIGKTGNSWKALQAKGGKMEGFVEAVGLDGTPRLFHYTPVPASDGSLFVAVGFAKSEIEAEAWRGFQHNCLILAVCTAVALLCAGIAARHSVLRHVQKLADAARRLSKREWDIQPVMKGAAAEFQQLGDTFVEMAGALRKQQEHLEEKVLQRTAQLTCSNIALMHEVETRQKREEDLQKVNRALKALSNSNQAMMRATNEPDYLKEVCKMLADVCGYSLVWIAYAENDSGKTIRPVAYSGFEEGYMESLKISWGDNEFGQGPAGRGIRSGKPCKCINILTDSFFAPWRDEAIKRGYSSTMTVPILKDGKAFGALAVYAKAPDAFTEEETNLLVQLAADLAHGIQTLRLRIEREKAQAEEKRRTELMLRTQKSLLEISKLPSENLEEFLRQVTKINSEVLQVDRASIWWISKDDSEIYCAEGFDRQGGPFSPRLLRKNFPNYFASLDAGMAIEITDVESHPLKAEFSDTYLGSTSVVSILHVPIRRSGRIVGILAHGHRGTPRAWDALEKDFAVSVAEAVAKGMEAAELRRAEAEKERLLKEVQDALAHVKTLRGLLPICAACKKIRDDQGYWNQIETYVSQHSEAQFSHGLCPECAKQYFPDYDPAQDDEPQDDESGNT